MQIDEALLSEHHKKTFHVTSCKPLFVVYKVRRASRILRTRLLGSVVCDRTVAICRLACIAVVYRSCSKKLSSPRSPE